jgi:hypothetical protein
MAEAVVLAQDWVIEIDNAGWVDVGGIESFTFSGEATEADTTTFESGGNAEHLISKRARSLKLTGKYKESVAGVQDAGQAAVETLASKIGGESIGQFRLTSPNGRARTFYGSASIDSTGGEHDKETKWEATIKVSGPVTEV